MALLENYNDTLVVLLPQRIVQFRRDRIVQPLVDTRSLIAFYASALAPDELIVSRCPGILLDCGTSATFAPPPR